MVIAIRGSEAELRTAVGAIPDPEIPVVTIADLGILRSLVAEPASGVVAVVITPTYSGCPAMEAISAYITHVCRGAGWEPRVTTQLSPAWTTEWMSEEGREKLRRFGIAPPGARHTGQSGAVPVSLGRRVVVCPRCGSEDTTELARFGSTACKALRRCEACRETFDEFKTL
jgi:ring-1,2-phenylacetyl-CoA epoxidase subunit PaaD